MIIDSDRGILHVTHDEVLDAIDRLPPYHPLNDDAVDHRYLQIVSSMFARRFSLDELPHVDVSTHTEAVQLSEVSQRLFGVVVEQV